MAVGSAAAASISMLRGTNKVAFSGAGVGNGGEVGLGVGVLEGVGTGVLVDVVVGVGRGGSVGAVVGVGRGISVGAAAWGGCQPVSRVQQIKRSKTIQVLFFIFFSE